LINIDCVFLDFDGVIKDSIDVKSNAFENLFLSFGESVAKKVRSHHEKNGGVSRFEKIPLYLSWAGVEVDHHLVLEYSDRFSDLVMQKVIESEWVPGIQDFLEEKFGNIQLFVVTATPQAEIDEIIEQLEIAHYFTAVVGAPTSKRNAIQALLHEFLINAERAVMIGDSISDYMAAQDNQIGFILRRTDLNQQLQITLGCLVVDDFTSLNGVV